MRSFRSRIAVVIVAGAALTSTHTLAPATVVVTTPRVISGASPLPEGCGDDLREAFRSLAREGGRFSNARHF
jgi:hypothetical protein